MYRDKWVIVGMALCLASLASCQAPSAIRWQRQFGTHESDVATSVGLDGEGNCYVVGSTAGRLGEESFGDRDIFIVKFDADGQQSWLRQFGTGEVDIASGMAVADDGSCFVTGRTAGSLGGEHAGDVDAFLVKWSNEGELLWARQIGGEWKDLGLGVAVDDAGGAYVCGATFNDLIDGGQSDTVDMFVARYDADGTQLWIRQFRSDGLNDGHDYARDLVVMDDGSICVVGWGWRMVAGDQDDGKAVVFYCDSDGNWLEGDQFGTHDFDTANCVAVGPTGDCYVAGYLMDNGSGAHDMFVARYDGNRQQWLVQDKTDNKGSATGTAVDDSGVYVVGWTGGNMPGDGLRDGVLIKYGFDGTELWRWQLDSGEDDTITDIALDAEGNCYIVGHSQGDLAGENQGAADAFVIVVSPTGDAFRGHVPR